MNKLQVSMECYDLSFDGKGVVSYNKKIGFVDNLLPGERAIVEITYEKKDTFFGKVVSLEKSSDKRVVPLCPSFEKCGGCALMHLSYQGQLEYKRKKVHDALTRIGGFKDIDVNMTVGMDDPYKYRNKVQVPLKMLKGKIVSGFYKEKSHDIVPVENCYIEDERAEKILKDIRLLIKKFKLKPYDEDKRTGIFRHVLIRTSHYFEEIMVTLVTTVDAFPGRNDFIKELKKMHPEITTITQNINSRDTNVILGEKERILKGPGFIKDSLNGILFKISPKSFYQVNPVQTEKLYNLAIEAASISKDDLLLDAYCGIGTISLIASKKAKFVHGVEIEPSAIQDAIKNAKNNNIENAYFYEGDAGEFIVNQQRNNINYDVVIMDPPRKGSTETFLNCLIKTSPKKIVYVSCDPATLARDLKYLKDYYEIKSVTPVDMFPQTFHVETVVLLCRKDIKK